MAPPTMNRILCIGPLLLLACGTKSDDPAPVPTPKCAELRVAVDGTPIEGLTHTIGVQDRRGGFVVHVFDHDQVTCEGAVRGVRTPQPNEVAVHVYVGATEALRAIGFGEHTEQRIAARLERRPAKAGDRISICVPEEVTFTPSSGRFTGRAVSVVGRFEAEFCGSQAK